MTIAETLHAKDVTVPEIQNHPENLITAEQQKIWEDFLRDWGELRRRPCDSEEFVNAT